MPKSMDYICLKDGHDWTGKPPSERERVKGRNTNLPRVPCPECGEYTGIPAEKLEKSGDSVTIDGKPIPRELWSDPEIQESAKEDILKSLGATDPEIEKLHREIRSLESREPPEPSASKKKKDELEAEAYKKGIDFLDDIRPFREAAQELKGEVKDFKNFIESSGKKNYFYAKILERLGMDVSDLKHEALEDMIGLAKSRSQKRKGSAAASGSEPTHQAGASDTGELEEFSKEEVEFVAFVFSFGLSKVLVDALRKVEEEAGADATEEERLRARQRLEESGNPAMKKLDLIWDFSREENELLNVYVNENLEKFIGVFGKFVVKKAAEDSEYQRVVSSIINTEVEEFPDDKFQKWWERWKHNQKVEM